MLKKKYFRHATIKKVIFHLKTMKEAEEYPLPFVLTGSQLKSGREDDGWMISDESESGELCLYTSLPTAL